jgi:hypothetical protein
MTNSDDPAISVERFLLTMDGAYTSAGFTVRGRTSTRSMYSTRSGLRSRGNSSTTVYETLLDGCASVL